MNKTFSYVLVILITALIVGGGVYYWKNNGNETKPVTTKVELEPETKDTKNNDFSFTVPDGYVVVEDGLWERERYQYLLDNPEAADFYRAPDVFIINEDLQGKTLDEFARSRHGSIGFDYEKNSSEFHNYNIVNIGSHQLIRILSSDLHLWIGYYLEYDGKVAGFVDPWLAETLEGYSDLEEEDKFLVELIKTIN